eukprot:1847097-Pyramimonas_sp.AAC.1
MQCPRKAHRKHNNPGREGHRRVEVEVHEAELLKHPRLERRQGEHHLHALRELHVVEGALQVAGGH